MSSKHRLVILRHAKSSWTDPEPDHARVLNKRGMRDGVAAGQWLANNIGTVDQVLCSTATRTRLTWERAQLGGARAAGISFHDEIYENEVKEFEHLIRELPATTKTALLIGHWPGVEELFRYLATPDSHPGWAQIAEKFPTSAIAVLDINVPWNLLAPGVGVLQNFRIPRG